MKPNEALNLIIQVVLSRATGNSVEIDQWRQALQVLQNVVDPKVQEEKKEEVKK
jgi:hypothetical protein